MGPSDLSLGLHLEFPLSEPVEVGHVASGLLPMLGVSTDSQTDEFASGPLWHLRLNPLRTSQGPQWPLHTHSRPSYFLHLHQDALVLLGKVQAPQEHGADPHWGCLIFVTEIP